MEEKIEKAKGLMGLSVRDTISQFDGVATAYVGYMDGDVVVRIIGKSVNGSSPAEYWAPVQNVVC